MHIIIFFYCHHHFLVLNTFLKKDEHAHPSKHTVVIETSKTHYSFLLLSLSPLLLTSSLFTLLLLLPFSFFYLPLNFSYCLPISLASTSSLPSLRSLVSYFSFSFCTFPSPPLLDSPLPCLPPPPGLYLRFSYSAPPLPSPSTPLLSFAISQLPCPLFFPSAPSSFLPILLSLSVSSFSS